VDLDIAARVPLDGLIQAMGDDVLVLHVGGNQRKYEAHIELASSPVDATADRTIVSLTRLIKRLPARHRKIWDRASSREFNVGIHAGVEPHAFELRLKRTTIDAITAVDGTLVVTIYAPDPASRSNREHVTHKRWNATLKRAMRLATSKPREAAELLEHLAQSVASTASSTVGDWHFEQTLALAGSVRSGANDHVGSSETLARLARHHDSVLRYQQRAVVSVLASRALELVAINDRSGAALALQQAAPLAKDLRPVDKLFERARKIVKNL
jgi:hypothetical protein